MRTDLASCVVADGEDKIQFRRTRRSELVPRFGAQVASGIIELFQQIEHHRLDETPGMAARAEGAEFASTHAIHDALGHDAAC